MEKIQKELQDIHGAIEKYVEANKKNVVFVSSFMAFDDDGEVKDNADRIFAYGNKESLLIQLNDLTKMVLEEEDDFVNW